jgi:hypothetical protein
MTVSSPLEFDDGFASDEELDRLEAELNSLNQVSAEADKFRLAIIESHSISDHSISFI